MAFETPQAPQDAYTASLFERHGLPAEPSLEDIEPIAKDLWEDPATRHEAAEMVLGHYIGSEMFQADPDLAQLVMFVPDASKAFGGLLIYRGIEEQQRAAAQ